MRLTTIWIHSFADSLPVGLRMAEVFRASGLDVRLWSGRMETSGGVVIFNDVSQALHEMVRLASDGGRRAVLGVCPIVAGLEPAQTVDVLASGAFDVLCCADPVRGALEAIRRLSQRVEIEKLVESVAPATVCSGTSPQWFSVMRSAVEIGAFSAGPVLLTGESGTGKEVVAGLIHQFDGRTPKRDMIVLDCTTLSRDLAGSELFGHVRGSYTGAIGDRVGAFELAEGGTLFLDEVGELPIPLQAELLRVVQERTFKAIGSNAWRRADFRVVAATHRDLRVDVQEGRFRHDLFHRLAGWQVRLPSLRERREDVIPLAKHFYSLARPGREVEFSADLLAFLRSHPFPGNVRELRHLMQRLADRSGDCEFLSLGQLVDENLLVKTAQTPQAWPRALEPIVASAVQQRVGLKDIGRIAEECAIRKAIADENGNLPRAASRLGITDRALQLRVAAWRQQAQSPIEPASNGD